MKKQYIIALFILAFTFGFSQQIAIPFRDGNKWGICNEKAEIIIEPKFDAVDFFENYANNYEVIISKQNNLKGLIINGKEILPPLYESIYEKGGKYIISKTANNQKVTDVILPNGTSIFTKPIAEIIRNENFADRFQLFHVLNPDMTESAFIFNPTTNTISQWLYENYYSLDVMRLKVMNTIGFKVKKTQSDGVLVESWDFSNFPNDVKKSERLGKSEADLMQVFMKKTYGKKGGYTGNSGNGTGRDEEERVVMMEDIKGDYDNTTVVPDAPNETSKSVKQPIYISKSFTIENDKLVLITQNQYGISNNKKITPVPLKIPMKDIEIKGYTTQEKRNDTIFYYNNTVIYKKNNRTGFLHATNTKNVIEFDTITKNVYTLHNDENLNDLVFIVGNKDRKSNRYKYGFYSFKKKLLGAVKYDKLTLTNFSYPNNVRAFISEEQAKFGLVTNDGIEIFKADNNDIKQSQTSKSVKLLQIKKNGAYTFMYQLSNGSTKIIPAQFNYSAKDLIFNYPGYSYKTNKEASVPLPTASIIELVDENGKVMGYASTNGLLYYKN